MYRDLRVSHQLPSLLILLVFICILILFQSSASAQNNLPYCSDVEITESGVLCIPDGSNFPNCYDPFGNFNAGLSENDPCENVEGQTCFVQSGGIDCPDVVANSCILPDNFVQACLYESGTGDQPPLLRQLTDRAVDGVLGDHDLPDSDTGYIYTYARNSARAHLWGELLRIFSKDERNAEEQEIVDFYSNRLKVLRIRQAEISKAEYDKFDADHCGYVPPAPYAFEPSSACGLPLAELFSTGAAHPTFEEFEAYGISEVTRQDILEDPEALAIAGGTSAAIVLGAGLAASLIVAASVFGILYLAGTTSALVTTLVGITAPYALVPFTLGGVGVTGVIGGIAGIAGAVGIVIFAVVGSVLIVKDFVDYQEFVDEVAYLETSSLVTPDLKLEVASERGVNDLYHVYLKSTQPEFLPYEAAPPATPEDPQFKVMDERGNQLSIQPSIELGLSDSSTNAGLTSLSARLHGGWFVPTVTYRDADETLKVNTTMSLGTEFVDWFGVSRVAWRRGVEFVVPEDIEDIENMQSEPDLRYLDPDGNRRIAMVFFDDTAPEVTYDIYGQTLNDSGWYVSSVGLQWYIEDPESEITSTQGCDYLILDTDGEFQQSCAATSAGGTKSSLVTIRRDTQPPSLEPETAPLPNAAGWNNTGVVVSHVCADPYPGSGVAACPGPVVFDQEGMQVMPAQSAKDVAGNSQFGTSFVISIDKTQPEISIQLPGNNVTYVTNQLVEVSWNVTDALSGMAETSASSTSGSALDTSTAGEFLFTVMARDKAANEAELSHSYTVLSPEQATLQLSDSLNETGTGKGVWSALTSKLSGVARAIAGNRTSVAVNELQAFINQVKAQAGKKISPEVAAILIAQAQTIINALQ